MIDETERRLLELERKVRELTEELSGRSQRVPRAVTTPDPSSANRGRIYRTEGGTGESDTVAVILKADDESYSAVNVATG